MMVMMMMMATIIMVMVLIGFYDINGVYLLDDGHNDGDNDDDGDDYFGDDGNKWSGFIIETGCVFYAIRMLPVSTIQVNLLTTSTPGRSAEGQAAKTNKMRISK